MKNILEVKPVGYIIRSNQKPTAYRTNGGLYDSRIEAAIVFKSRTEADIINGDRNSDVLPVWSSPVSMASRRCKSASATPKSSRSKPPSVGSTRLTRTARLSRASWNTSATCTAI